MQGSFTKCFTSQNSQTLEQFFESLYVNNTLQQGDCNGPSSWQRFMTYVFQDRIGVEVWVYLDNIYIFSKTIEEHENALEYVFNCLKREQLFISPTKLKPYAIWFNCLGHTCDETDSELRSTSWSSFTTGQHHRHTTMCKGF